MVIHRFLIFLLINTSLNAARITCPVEKVLIESFNQLAIDGIDTQSFSEAFLQLSEIETILYNRVNKLSELNQSDEISKLMSIEIEVKRLREKAEELWLKISDNKINKDLLDEIKMIKEELKQTIVKLKNPKTSIRYEDAIQDPRNLKPGYMYSVEIRGQNRPLKVIFEEGVVSEVMKLDPVMLKKFLKVIPNGFVGKRYAQGIKHFSGIPNAVEIKILADGRSGARLFGCLKNGILTIREYHHKNVFGDTTGQRIQESLKGLCDD